MRKRFLGSTIALVLGVLMLISGLGNPVSAGSGLIVGPVMILGAVAYRSRKKRLLGLLGPSRTRVGLELAALATICAMILLQNNLAERVYYDPFPNLIVPLWALIAYGLAGLRARRVETAPPAAV